MNITPKWIVFFTFMSLMSLSVDVFSAEDGADSYKIKRNTNHEIKLLNNGLASLEERLQMIERAEISIDIEYFIYRVDKSAQLFTNALIKKSREGVKVRLLLDYFMVKSDLSPFYTHEMEQAGIAIKYFNTTATLNLFKGQYRNHRKVLLIDGVEAMTGGRNIGDEYFDLDQRYNFLDRDILIKGEIVTDIQKTFNDIWNAKYSKQVAREEMPSIDDSRYQSEGMANEHTFKQDLAAWSNKVYKAVTFVKPIDQNLENEIRAKGRQLLAQEYTGACQSIVFNSEYSTIGKDNRKNNRIIKHDILKRIENANKSVLIDSPYFIVNNELTRALDKALSKNVAVKLLTNSLNSTDAIYVYTVFDSMIKGWIKKGIETYIFKGHRPEGYKVIEKFAGKSTFGVHAKTLIFDDKDVMIGTYNLDPRSANYNTEMTVTCENNPELAEVVKADIEMRIKESLHLDSNKKVDEAKFYQIGFAKKLTYYALKGVSHLFIHLL